ncbi:MAG: winged helix-turn-helix transcriptional regulator [Candidatus Thermoplasmatota archaeon]|nr:winged helix-turn-helix transcriptional regulator [Candidatus Thermoplasmatota archaeon]MBS3790869.1 winged helix-turn-helix transcriptional regulator [Candidatus Thermoplasmatota archaeon]
MKILIELQKDGRLSRRVLADRIDVSTPTVSSKMEKLENMEIIEGFSVKVDYRKMGFQKYFFKIDSNDKTEEEIREVFSRFEGFRKIEKLEGNGHLITLFINEFSQLDKATEYLEEKDGFKIKEVWRTQDEEKKSPKISLDENVPLDITCYYCNKPIKGEPEKWKKDGKEHYFCCPSCEELYEEKYERLQRRKKEMRNESQ